MQAELDADEYVFLTSDHGFGSEVESSATMVFKEVEGVTVITKKKLAQTLTSGSEPIWAKITLNVHSDLQAVGFLAAMTRELANAGISVNAVSAYYHDHLFVPWERRNEALSILQSF